MRESVIERHLVARVKALGGEVRKVKWIGRRGAPDRLVMLPRIPDENKNAWQWDNHAYFDKGRSFWVELKATGIKPEPHQVREHVRMREMGQHVVVIDSIEGVEELLS